jgi:F-type H+-transporting ATPase subunit b
VNNIASAKLFASAINVDFDATFVAQFVLFTLFIVVLRPLLFDPLLRVFEEREKRTEGAKEDARKMDAKAGELLTRYEAELDKVRREANVEREKLRKEAKDLETQIMSKARAEAAQILENGKARMAREVEQMKKELEDAKPALASEIASRVLGREVSR